MTVRSRTINDLRLLDSVDLPEGLDVNVTTDAGTFMTRQATLNKANHVLFGMAFRQGNRIQFTTSMTLNDYLALAEEKRAEKGWTVEQLRNVPNRPKIESHQKDIRNYLKETACVGAKWIFPNFSLNFGAGWTEESPKGKLTLLVSDEETLAWPAIFEPPAGKRLSVADGAHRTNSARELLDALKDAAASEALLSNAVGVTVVMEANKDQAHQDFSDMAKAKPISDSVRGTFDVRDIVGRFTRDLVQQNDFLKVNVDATSPSVNLSSNSVRVWSMSAVRGYILNSIPGYDKLSDEAKKAALADIEPFSDYIDSLADHLPILRDIATGVAKPGEIRKQRGGCVLLRGAGWGILMHARAQAIANGIAPEIMAERLGDVDWFVLKDGADPRPVDAEKTYDWLKVAAQPAWLRMTAINIEKGTYRIKGARDNILGAFDELKSELLAA
jgi:hypothetical protein